MARPPKPPKAPKQMGQVEVLVHADTRRNIPTAEFQSIAQQMEEQAPVTPPATSAPRRCRRERHGRATPTWTRNWSGAACASG